MGGVMEKKGQKFRVPDLSTKVRTLEAVFGEKFMRKGLNPRTIDKWLKEPGLTPYLNSLKIYFGVVGMKESDMVKPRHTFSEAVSEIHYRLKEKEDVQYTPEDVMAIYDSFHERSREEPVLLGTTLKMISRETMSSDYRFLKGEYHMYHYWKSGVEAKKVRRNLVSVYDIDEKKGVMHSRIMVAPMKHKKREDWWEYEGWVFNLKNTLFWLFECVKGMPPEVVTFYIFKPHFWPDPEQFFLYGIVSALSLDGLPSASNILLNKIEHGDPLRGKLGYFSPEEIAAEGHGIDILRYIDNRTKGAHDILSAKSS
jgi:hypothetical protein